MRLRHWGHTVARRGHLMVYLLPPSQKDWARALLAELEEIERCPSALGWVLGGGRVVARGWIGSITGEDNMKMVLATLSVINGLMGLTLLGLFLFTDDTPLVVPALGVGLLIQAGYTLAYMGGVLDALEPWSQRALLAGQTVAVLVGFFGFVASALYNVAPPGGDYEYGPLTIGALIAVQASVALWIFAVQDRPERARVAQP